MFCALDAVRAADDCAQPLGRMVSVQGDVQLVRAGRSARTELNAPLCAGDQIRVPLRGRAAVALANETMVRLDQGSTLTLGAPTPEDASPLGICSGALYVITRTPRRFKVRTPFMNASVEGTEFLVEVTRAGTPPACEIDDAALPLAATQNEAARISVVEGQVQADNANGSIALRSGESASDKTLPGNALTIRPREAASWTLHVPTVLGYQVDAGSGALSADVQRLGDPERSIRIAAALAELEAAASASRVLVPVRRASLLLLLGRLDEARRLIEGALLTPPAERDTTLGDAHALAAVIAVAQNDKTEAQARANAALLADPQSAAGWIALSYAQQADFRLEEALASAQRADAAVLALGGAQASGGAPSPQRALALARTAELHLALGDLRAAQATADRALAANPALARTQLVFGFAYLLRFDTGRASKAFRQAISLDQADPLPRLGLGLATIRRGDLAAGRAELEIAVGLDPANALVRSYLGKAYHEERRGKLAATQLDLAKLADPNDPTGYLYNAIRLHAANRPIEALTELQRSLALNDNRAVYRSRLLLDQDRATRQADLATIFSDLGAKQEATSVAAASLADDPSNAAAHRFLAEAYAQRERHDIGRTSELLQAQLLQAPGLAPVSPELPFVELGAPGFAAQGAGFASEASSMFERDRLQASVGALRGNLGTESSRVAVAGLYGSVSGGAGAFHHSSEGFRPNGDISHRLWNAHLQWAVSPEMSIQGERRERHTRYGDVLMSFDPDFFSRRDRTAIDQRSSRIGLAFRPGARTTLLASTVRANSTVDFRIYEDGVYDFLLQDTEATLAHELQLQHRADQTTLVIGVGRSRVASTSLLVLDYTPSLGIPCDPTVAPCEGLESTRLRQWNGYVYANFRPSDTVATTLGLSRDSYTDREQVIRTWNPKLGLRAALSAGTTFRAAAFRTLKRSLVTQRSIEPTQVMGFSQFYDDLVGSVSRVFGAALDTKLGAVGQIGLELGEQLTDLNTGTVGAALNALPPQKSVTRWWRLDLGVRPSPQLALGAGLSSDRFAFDAIMPRFPNPTFLSTTRLPLSARWFLPTGLYADLTVSTVHQRVRRRADTPVPVGTETFTVADLSLGYRLPFGQGTLSLDIKNLFDARFFYQDDNFRATEVRPAPYLPVRRAWVKASLAF